MAIELDIGRKLPMDHYFCSARFVRRNMAGKMNRGFFDENRNIAVDEVQICMRLAEEARGLICSVNYALPDLISPQAVHDALSQIVRSAEHARYQFEKARWAATSTTMTLGEWLKEYDCAELVRFGD
jgi:hypothetical protein